MDLTGIGSIFDFARTVVDKIWPPGADPQKKLEAELSLQAMLQARETGLLTAQKEIIVSEMAQGDTYTKRARPTIVYAGLAFIFLVNVMLPFVAYFTGSKTLPDVKLPGEFWWAWSGVCGIWVIGRSAEKRGVENKMTKLVVGK